MLSAEVSAPWRAPFKHNRTVVCLFVLLLCKSLSFLLPLAVMSFQGRDCLAVLIQWLMVYSQGGDNRIQRCLTVRWFGDVRLQNLPPSGTNQTHTWLFLWPPPHIFLLCVNTFFPLAEFHLHFTLTYTYLYTHTQVSPSDVYTGQKYAHKRGLWEWKSMSDEEN